MNTPARQTGNVIGSPIDFLDWDTAISRIDKWVDSKESRVICICNAHSVVTARQNPEFAQIIANADMATPDGAPVAWLLQKTGNKKQARINGPDLMLRYCAHAAHNGRPIYLYGASDATLAILIKNLSTRFPGLKIAGAYSPPFRPLTPEEDAAVVEAINRSGAGVVWVSLGCPKQEKWMAAHHERIHAVMVGVGAAFDYHAGTITRAPLWMQRNGLEWIHRLCSEPKRLWRRYLLTNSLFIWHATRQILFGSNDSQIDSQIRKS